MGNQIKRSNRMFIDQRYPHKIVTEEDLRKEFGERLLESDEFNNITFEQYIRISMESEGGTLKQVGTCNGFPIVHGIIFTGCNSKSRNIWVELYDSFEKAKIAFDAYVDSRVRFYTNKYKEDLEDGLVNPFTYTKDIKNKEMKYHDEDYNMAIYFEQIIQ